MAQLRNGERGSILRTWRPHLEQLEDRLSPAAAPGVFAELAGPGRAAIHVLSADFDLPAGGVVLGFRTRGAAGADSGPPLARLEPLSFRSRALPLVQRSAVGEQAALSLYRVRLGDYLVRVAGPDRLPGGGRAEVFLAGDVNGDFAVNRADLGLIRTLRGVTRAGQDYRAAADVNGDGVIDARDLALARLNLGASTRCRLLRPLAVNLSPDSDPDHNQIVLQETAALVGQTLPQARVQVLRGGSGRPIARGRADAQGRYRLEVHLAPGINDLQVVAADRFGQRTAAGKAVAWGDVILNWNATHLNALRDFTTLSNDPYPNRIVYTAPPLAARNLAMVHAAMYDAVMAFAGTHELYRPHQPPPAGAAPEAAAAAAAHAILTQLYPDDDETLLFTSAYFESLAAVPDGPAEDLGIAYGESIAADMLSWRAADGASRTIAYQPGEDPGEWRRTFPDYLPPLIPQWPGVTPFTMSAGSQFRPPPPPELGSMPYAADWNEVRMLGGFVGSARTEEQTEIALFWADGPGTFTPPGHWNQIAQELALARRASLADNARLFAHLNLALADAGIVSWDAKYAYNLWRPIDAIRLADQDGNDQTSADAAWIPLLKTPNFPTYTSGHSTFSAAAAMVLAHYFGAQTRFTTSQDGLNGFTQRPLAGVLVRSFDSFDEAAHEASRSRVYGGIHFEFDCAQGLASGQALGEHVLAAVLRRR